MRIYDEETENKLIKLGIHPKEIPFKVIDKLLELIPEQLNLFTIKKTMRQNNARTNHTTF